MGKGKLKISGMLELLGMDTHIDTHTKTHRYTHTDTHRQTDTHRHTHRYTHTYTDTHTQTHTHTHTNAVTVRSWHFDSEPSEGRASFASGVLTTRTVWLSAEVQQPTAKSQLLIGRRRGREGRQILSEIIWCLAL